MRALFEIAKVVRAFIVRSCGSLVEMNPSMALKHHYIDKNSVLRKMLPERVSVILYSSTCDKPLTDYGLVRGGSPLGLYSDGVGAQDWYACSSE
jgi:hypothetical protein